MLLFLQETHHAFGIPVEVLDQAIVVPGGDAPEAWVPVQQDGGCSEKVQEVWAEEHVILADDDMAVPPAWLKQPVQAPLVVLREPSMPWLTA